MGQPRLLLLVFACVLVLTLGCAPAPAPTVEPAEPEEPLHIRLIYGLPTIILIGMMTEKTDILEHYGTEYTLETTRIDPTSEVANLLAAGEADIGFTATGPLINSNLRLDGDMRILGDVSQIGVEGHNAHWFTVLDDSPFQEISDLQGATIGSLGFGTFIDLSMRVGLEKGGIDPERDVTIVEVSFPAMEANLRDGRIDMAQFVPPFFQIARANGNIRPLFTTVDSLGEVQVLFLVGREQFLRENPRRVQAFFDDYYRFLQYALDPENRDEMIEIGARMQDLPPEGFRAWWNTQEDFYHAPDGLPNIDAIKNEMEILAESGLIDRTVDIDEWVDLSFIERARENYER